VAPMPRKKVPSLTYLGRSTPAPTTPDEAILDRILNRHSDAPFAARFSAPEFTVLCAVTGQPDFAHMVIDYVPREWLIESKSLKFYLASFRNQSGFHEDCTIRIGKRLYAVLQPLYLRIGGYWYPRGGMPIDVFWAKGRLPKGVWLPDQGIVTYRGRG
jgi:7-cyano-7-deazaguanine reductase